MIDAFVVGLYFITIIWVGLTRGVKDKTLEGYALGSRSIPWWAIVASILAAEISCATFLGAPGEGFAKRNFTYAQLLIGTILARGLVALIFIRRFYEHGVISIYEFLELRFGRLTRCLGSLIFLFTRALASGTRLYVAAIFIVIGIELWTGHKPTQIQELWIYGGTILFILAATSIYTTLGGIKAVVWTDVIQATILILSLISTISILVWNIPGGITGVYSALQGADDLKLITLGIDFNAGLKQNLKNIFASEYTIWSALLGSTFITLATHGTDQDMVQRMLTAKNATQSRWSVFLSGIAAIPVLFSFLTIGILLYVYYHYEPDPNLPAKNPNIFPYFILTQMPSGLRGLLIAALLATAMGSLSTALNALATSFARDFYIPYICPQAGESQKLRATRSATVGFAALLLIIGVGTAWVVVRDPEARILPIVIGAFGYTYGSLLGVFLVAVLTRGRGNDRGNLIAIVCGFGVVALLTHLPTEFITLIWGSYRNFASIFFEEPFWMMYNLETLNMLPKIAFPWRVFFGALTTFFVALLFTTPREKIRSLEVHRNQSSKE